MKLNEVFFCWLYLTAICFPAISSAKQNVSFNRDVRPILSDRCFHCHGPDEEDRHADLRLDKPADSGDSEVIAPGSIEDSELWLRITATDDSVMPPLDSSKKPLTDAEKETIRKWIEQGAAYEQFWAFVSPKKHVLPNVSNPQWSRSSIDRFVMHRLEKEALKPSLPASRRTMIRRLSLDLTGLPPTRDEIHTFLADTNPEAYERLVDRLLAKPQYGEHMAKYWLDLVRFADTNGIHHDHFRDMTPYRDWVIQAFNENLPYDEFVRYQLAGDLFSQPTQDQLVATGFNRLHLIIDVGTALPEESHSRNVIDRVTAVGTAFLGLTVQCAVCHDHKYDPITMKEFYSLSAFFNNLDAKPETGGRRGSDFERGLQMPYISLASDEQQESLDRFDVRIAELTQLTQSLEKKLEARSTDGIEGEGNKETLAEPQEKSTTEDLTMELAEAKKALTSARNERKTFEDTISFAMVMKERPQPRATYVMIRGEYDNPGEKVDRGTPGFLPPLTSVGDTKTRMDLANWFVSPEHPLTARVAVNRFWQQMFGVGIVKTSEDFGAQGDWPSHPRLLDYLAATFIESGWNVKALVKQIVMSKTYRQSSESTPQQVKNDPENRLLSRGSRFRMDSELIRDQFLATSGLLNNQLYGKSVKPPQPDGLWKAVNMPSSYPYSYQPDSGKQIYRRSVYTFWKRSMPPPQMTIFNAPNREACTARRERTNTPLQALLLMNEPEYLKASRHLASKTIADRSLSDHQRLVIIYESITSMVPDENETKDMLTLIEDLKKIYQNDQELAEQMCSGIQLKGDVSPAELAAWTMLVSTIYNLDIAKNRG